jgi:hypothetical protein
MNKFSSVILSVLPTLLLLVGCSSTDNKIEKGVTACTDPRPEMCTQDYNPTCGLLKNGGEKTYSNACTACSDSDVASYKPGICE